MISTGPASQRANPWAPCPARIRNVNSEFPGTSTYELELEDESDSAAFRFRPGQFNMLYLPGFGEAAISISSDADAPQTLSHTVKAVGNVTQALARCGSGDQILLRGPFGSAWPIDARRGGNIVVACGGIGLAPLRPVIYHIINHRQDFGCVDLLYGARSPDVLLYRDEFESWRAAGIQVEVTVDKGDADWRGQIGAVPLLFSRLRLDAENTRVFTCGPEIMMRFVIFEALARRISPDHIWLSMERNMNCAIGFCGHCQLGPAFICMDGPVFTYEQMAPYLHIEDL